MATQVFTIGFNQKPAKEFFTKLSDTGVKRVIDVRLHNSSQLAGFTKKDDLKFFLKELCAIDYLHLPDLAPTQAIYDAYKKSGGTWQTYQSAFLELMSERQIEKIVTHETLSGGCLLCSESSPYHCHRKLVLEYLVPYLGAMDVTHIE